MYHVIILSQDVGSVIGDTVKRIEERPVSMYSNRQTLFERTGQNSQGRVAVSIIMPVLNEAESINGAISRVLELQSPGKNEIIVVDGDPKGGTVSSIRHGSVITAISGAVGRARQMNLGSSLARGAVLLFLHADTVLPDDAFAQIAASMAGDRFVAGAFDLGIDSPSGIFRITERYVALRTRITRIPFGDQAVFMRKGYFDEIGGFSDIPIMEDVDLMKRIRKRGDSIIIVPEQVKTSPRRWEREGVLRCTIRNWALQLAYALGAKPEWLAKWYP